MAIAIISGGIALFCNRLFVFEPRRTQSSRRGMRFFLQTIVFFVLLRALRGLSKRLQNYSYRSAVGYGARSRASPTLVCLICVTVLMHLAMADRPTVNGRTIK
jgi:hypothetical protein